MFPACRVAGIFVVLAGESLHQETPISLNYGKYLKSYYVVLL